MNRTGLSAWPVFCSNRNGRCLNAVLLERVPPSAPWAGSDRNSLTGRLFTDATVTVTKDTATDKLTIA